MDKKRKSPAVMQGLTNEMKDSKYHTQLQDAFESYYLFPKTMLQVSRDLGVDRGNICQYNKLMRQSDAILLLHKGLCPISGHKAGFYTTNPAYRIESLQLTLFNEI